MERWKVTVGAILVSLLASAGSARTDYRSQAIRGARSLQAAKTCSAEFTWTIYPPGTSVEGKIYLAKPHFIHCESTSVDAGQTITLIQRDDGERGIQLTEPQVTSDLNTTNRELARGVIEGTWGSGLLREFFDSAQFVKDYLPRKSRIIAEGETRVGDTLCETLKISDPEWDLHLMQLAPDGTCRGYTRVWRQNTEANMVTARLTRLVLDEPLPQRILNWKPPAGRAKPQ